MNWASHVKYICNKISKGIGIIGKAKKYLDKRCLKFLYNSFVLPYLTYCIEVWGKAKSVHIKPLITIQKKIVRILDSASYLAHSSPIFNKLDILTVKQIYVYRTGIFMFKIINSLVPTVFRNVFNFNTSIHSYETRSSKLLHVSHAGKDTSQQNLRFAGVSVWNNISSKIDCNVKISVFKENIRHFVKSVNQFA